MSGTSRCERYRDVGQRLLDGDLLASAERRAFETHVGSCAGCADWLAELKQIQSALNELPCVPLPAEGLDAVLSRTVLRRRWSGVDFGAWRLDWSAAVATAVVTLALLGVWREMHPVPVAPSEFEIAEAAEQTRMVLALTAQALKKTEQAALGEVLTDRVSPALRRVPIRWPRPGADESRSSDSGA